MDKIPFCKSTLGEEEKKAVCDVIDSGWVVMGKKTLEFEQLFADYVGGKYAIFVDSGTSALDLSVKWHLYKKHIKKTHGRISVPSLTFTATAEVIRNNNLRIRFVEVNKKTFCYEGFSAQPLIKVHLTGNEAKGESGQFVIEDSAHRIERNQCKHNPNLVCFSFYATKNMTTIQGGMIVTNDEECAQWLRMARDHGVTKGTTERYKEGSWSYDIKFIGWREKSDDIHAAIGIEQLKKLDSMNAKRKLIIDRYNEVLNLKRTGIHLYPVLVENRTDFIKFMSDNNIQCSVHFLPLHLMTGYRKQFRKEEAHNLKNTEYLGERLVSLPLYPGLTDEQVDYILGKVLDSKLLIREY